jgi:hypothetical protein
MVKKQINPSRKLTKRGKAKLMPTPFYPKRYSVEVTLNESGDDTTITRSCENFSAWELYGMLKLVMLEIERQMKIRPEDELKVD